MASIGGYFLYVTVTFSILVWTPSIILAERTMTKCFKGSEAEPFGDVTFGCPEGSVISVTDAVLGRNAWLECLLTEDDCVQPIKKIFQDCEGLTNCSRRFKTYSARCGYITILLLSYNCLQTALVTPTPSVTLIERSTSQIPTNRSPANVDQSDAGPYLPPKSQPARGGSGDGNDEEVGLIVATIAASILTAFMLIVAIIMTIRRLLDYPTINRRGNGESSSRLVTCLEGVCVQVDKFPCFHGPGDLSGQESLRSRKSNIPMTQEEEVQSSRQRRMAPIGQESSEDTVDPSREQEEDVELNMTDIRTEPDQNLEKVVKINTKQRVTDLRQPDIKGSTAASSSTNDCRKPQDKICEWDAKDIHGQSDDNKINNNNNIVDKSNIKMLPRDIMLVADVTRGTNMSTLPFMSGNNSVGRLPIPAMITNHPREVNLPAKREFILANRKPYFDAIVVPNTESSSKC